MRSIAHDAFLSHLQKLGQAIALASVLAVAPACSPLDLAINGGSLVVQGIIEAVGEANKSSTPSTTYCQTANSANVYSTTAGDCSDGDKEIKSWEYNKRAAENRDASERETRLAAQAEQAQSTYCLTSVSHTAYVSPSGECHPGEQNLSKSEYEKARSDAASAATAISQIPPE